MLVKSQLYKNDIESFSLLYESQIELLASNMYVRNRHKKSQFNVSHFYVQLMSQLVRLTPIHTIHFRYAL
jgi:hypothetical protein